MRLLRWTSRFFDHVVYGFCKSVARSLVMHINGPCELFSSNLILVRSEPVFLETAGLSVLLDCLAECRSQGSLRLTI